MRGLWSAVFAISLVASCGGSTSSPKADASTDGATDAGNPYPPGSCPAVCTDSFGGGHKFTSVTEVMQRLAGKWVACPGGAMPLTTGPAIEFTADGKIYMLQKMGDVWIRGTRPQDQGTYMIDNSDSFTFDHLGNFGLTVDTPGVTMAVAGSLSDLWFVETGFLSDCPRRIRLLDGPMGMFTDSSNFAATP
jgi:hypothetical protein